MEEVTVYLDSNSATKIANQLYSFNISPSINISNDEVCHVYLKGFSTLNAIPNIDEENNSLIVNDTQHTIPQGFYTREQIASIINNLTKQSGHELSAVFDEKTLKLKLASPNSFTLEQTKFLDMLNISAGTYTEVESRIAVDLLEGTHNLYVQIQEIFTRSRYTGSSFIKNGTLAKIPILNPHGEYTFFEAQNPVSLFLISNTSSLSTFTVSLYNDNGSLYETPRFCMTLVFRITKKSDSSDIKESTLEYYLDKILSVGASRQGTTVPLCQLKKNHRVI